MIVHRAKMVAMVGSLIVGLLSTSITSGVADGAGTLAITGYIEQGSAPSAIERSAPALRTVGVDGVNLNHAGSDVTAIDGSALSLLKRAHTDGLRAEILFGNFDDVIGDFSPRIAANLLDSAANQRAVATRLATIVTAQGWDGITVDLESLSGADQSGLVNFVTALRTDLPASRSLSIDVSASTSMAGYVAEGYDLARLGHVVDRVVLMAYDQHGPWSQPGPIGALNWQRSALAVLLTRVSAAQVDLGVAGYGYTWPSGSQLHAGSSISDAVARRLTREGSARAHWSAASGEWTATLKDGTVLWWSDARSFRLRVAMALHFRLHGLALWQLASSDPLTR